MTHVCPHCPKTFGDQNGLYSHVKAKHGRRNAQAVRPVREEEPSMAELHIAAIEARAAGEPVEPIIAEMFEV